MPDFSAEAFAEPITPLPHALIAYGLPPAEDTSYALFGWVQVQELLEQQLVPYHVPNGPMGPNSGSWDAQILAGRRQSGANPVAVQGVHSLGVVLVGFPGFRVLTQEVTLIESRGVDETLGGQVACLIQDEFGIQPFVDGLAMPAGDFQQIGPVRVNDVMSDQREARSPLRKPDQGIVDGDPACGQVPVGDPGQPDYVVRDGPVYR